MAGERTEFDCTVGYVGKKPPDVNWLTGNLPVNATDLQVKKNIIKATLGIKTSPGMNGHTYHCQISYTGIFSTLCPAHTPLLLNVSCKLIMFNPVMCRGWDHPGQGNKKLAPCFKKF